MKRFKLFLCAAILLTAVRAYGGHIESGIAAAEQPPAAPVVLDPLAQLALDLFGAFLALF